MVKLQAATVYNNLPKKRKRKTQDAEPEAPDDPQQVVPDTRSTSTTTVPTKTDDGGAKPRRTGKAKKPGLVRRESSGIVECTIPWPERFKTISQLHRALNLTYTFCCTRKHIATTFETLRSTVESHIKRELTIQDVAEIKALIPQALTFAYVDEDKLQVELLGYDQGFRKSRVGELPPLDSIGRENNEEGHQVLLFEFIDQDLKRQVQHKGEVVRAHQKLKHEELKMPVFSQKQMLGLIEKRNNKFTSAINAFLNQCAADGIDPELTLAQQLPDYIPVPSTSRDHTPRPDRRAVLPASIPTERKTIPDIIAEMKTLEWYSGQIVPDGHRVFDPQQPVYGDLSFALTQNLSMLSTIRSVSRSSMLIRLKRSTTYMRATMLLYPHLPVLESHSSIKFLCCMNSSMTQMPALCISFRRRHSRKIRDGV